MGYHEQLPWDGKSPEDILRDIGDDVLDYVTWYTENGMHLPPDYERDPAGWTQVLRDIEAAVEILFLNQEVDDIHEGIKNKGVALFYKYAAHLFI